MLGHGWFKSYPFLCFIQRLSLDHRFDQSGFIKSHNFCPRKHLRQASMRFLVRSNERTGRYLMVFAIKACDDSPRLANDQHTRCHIPCVEVGLEVCGQASGLEYGPGM